MMNTTTEAEGENKEDAPPTMGQGLIANNQQRGRA